MRQGPDGLVEVGGLAVALLLLAAPEVDPAAPGRKDMVNMFIFYNPCWFSS